MNYMIICKDQETATEAFQMAKRTAVGVALGCNNFKQIIFTRYNEYRFISKVEYQEKYERSTAYIFIDLKEFENVMDLSDFSVANSGEFDISNVIKFVNEMYYECLYRKTETRINRRIEVNQNECNNIN